MKMRCCVARPGGLWCEGRGLFADEGDQGRIGGAPTDAMAGDCQAGMMDMSVCSAETLTPDAPQGSGKEVKDVAAQFGNRANWLKHDVARRIVLFFGKGGPWQIHRKLTRRPEKIQGET